MKMELNLGLLRILEVFAVNVIFCEEAQFFLFNIEIDFYVSNFVLGRFKLGRISRMVIMHLSAKIGGGEIEGEEEKKMEGEEEEEEGGGEQAA
jgi:hypothetical protein